MVFGLDNNDAISGIQFDLNYDPSLFTIVDKTENGERAKNMTVTHRTLASGTERYFCYFLDNTSIAKGSGEIFKIYLRSDTAVSNGTYPVMISNIKLATSGLKDMNAGTEYSTEIYVEHPVVIRAVNVTREYGDDNPEFTFIAEGNTVNGTPEITCEATKKSPVGTYPIIIKKGSVANYNATYINGTLTITKAPLTITVQNEEIFVGQELPELSVTYAGFKNGETEENLTSPAKATAQVDNTLTAGIYKITASGAEAQNYEMKYVDGQLTIKDITAQKRELRADYDKLADRVDSVNRISSRNEILTTAMKAAYSANATHIDSISSEYERCMSMLSELKIDEKTRSELNDSLSLIKAEIMNIKTDNEAVKQSIEANQTDKNFLMALNDTVTIIRDDLNALSIYPEIEPLQQRLDKAIATADDLLANENSRFENQRNNKVLIDQYQVDIQNLNDWLNRVKAMLEAARTGIRELIYSDKIDERVYNLNGIRIPDKQTIMKEMNYKYIPNE